LILADHTLTAESSTILHVLQHDMHLIPDAATPNRSDRDVSSFERRLGIPITRALTRLESFHLPIAGRCCRRQVTDQPASSGRDFFNGTLERQLIGA
jgi:hypothetical protein